MSYQLQSRITACPPLFVGRESGTIEKLDQDKIGTIYFVRLDRHPRQLLLFRSQDLERECSEGGAHEWDGSICSKCFEEREVK